MIVLLLVALVAFVLLHYALNVTVVLSVVLAAFAAGIVALISKRSGRY